MVTKEKGFTLLEILLVVAALSILAGVVIVAINPGKQLADTRDAQRRMDVNTILNAFYQYSLDNNGQMPDGLDNRTDWAQILGTSEGVCRGSCDFPTLSVCLDVSDELIPKYLVDIPIDPSGFNSSRTNYYVTRTEEGRLLVGACSPEMAEEITVTR